MSVWHAAPRRATLVVCPVLIFVEQREGEAPAEPLFSGDSRLGRSLALPRAKPVDLDLKQD